MTIKVSSMGFQFSAVDHVFLWFRHLDVCVLVGTIHLTHVNSVISFAYYRNPSICYYIPHATRGLLSVFL